jgi:hypothetical protein
MTGAAMTPAMSPAMTRFAWLTPLVCVLVGCNEREDARVTGSVKYEGKPLAAGFITFTPKENRGVARGASVDDGKFECDGLLPGSYQVLISTPAKYEADPNSKSGLKAAPQVKVPDDVVGNLREVEVVRGTQTLDFDLQKPATAK